MPRQAPYLQRRSDTLYFRIAVPPDLRKLLGGREITKTLKTSDRGIALPVALSLAAKAKQLFNQLRRKMANKDMSSELIRLDYTLSYDFDELGLVKKMSIQAEPHENEAVIAAATAIIENNAQARQRYTVVPNRVIVQTNQAVVQRAEAIPTLKAVVDRFLNGYQQNKKPAMYQKHKPVLSMFLEVVGDKPITALKQADINEFFELIGRMPPRWSDECRKRKLTIRELAELDFDITLGPKSFEDTYIASVRPFLRAAKKDWQDQGFPLGLTTEGIEYLGDREEDESKQRAFKPEELVRLFEGNEVTGFAKDIGQHHRYWILHLGLFTGARVNEICQINPHTDILQDEESGDWYLWITKETESDSRVRKSVKTGDSRKVPIHHKLIELGFLAYVERVKAGGHKLLFPEWLPINRRASGEAEKWVRQFLRDTNLRDETPKAKILGMHAFRHTLLTYGAMQKPPLSLFCITGHAQDETPIHATGAGKGYLTLSLLSPLSDRKDLLDQLDYNMSFHVPVTA
jgi:integrase